MGSVSSGVGSAQHRAVLAEVHVLVGVGVLPFAERLTEAVAADSTDSERRTAARRHDCSEVPIAKHVSEYAAVRFKERLRPKKALAVDKFVVVELRSVHRLANVVGIERRVAGCGLRLATGTERAAPGEIRNGGNSMPIVHRESGIERVVVARAGTIVGVNADRLPGRKGRSDAARNGPPQFPGACLTQGRPKLEDLRQRNEAIHARITRHRRRATGEAFAKCRGGPAQRGFKPRLRGRRAPFETAKYACANADAKLWPFKVSMVGTAFMSRC